MKKLIALTILALTVNAHAKPIKVAVIDTGFDFKGSWQPNRADIPSTPTLCLTGHKDFTGTGLQDDHGHGTHIAGLIGFYAGKADYCIVVYKFYDSKGSDVDNLINTIKSFKAAIAEGVDIINYSGGGIARNDQECQVVTQALNKGIKVIVAAGNERSNLDTRGYYPALCDTRTTIVEATYSVGGRIPSSNFSTGKYATVKELGNDVLSILPNSQWGFMTGTSQATAIHSGKTVQLLYNIRNLDNLYWPKYLRSRLLMLASVVQ